MMRVQREEGIAMTVSPSFAGQVAFITGASRGIGRATALLLAREGCSLALVGQNLQDLTETAEVCSGYGGAVLPLQADLSDPTVIPSLIEQCVQAFGQLNILINNAGVFDWASVVDAKLTVWDTILDVNLRATMHLTHQAAPHIIKHQRGAIIFIASMAGKRAFGTNAAYVASKHGMVGFAGSIFEDVRNHNVKVCAICPGFVNAGASRTMDVPEETFTEFIQPEDVARTVHFVLTFPNNACPTEILLSPQLPLA